MQKIIALGWDVGGWKWKNHGLSGFYWDGHSAHSAIIRPVENGLIRWNPFQSIQEIAAQFKVHPSECMGVLGIDAPLGMPLALKQFLNQSDWLPSNVIDSNSNNVLAYRATERYLMQQKVQPLSPVTDKIGHCAFISQLHIRAWRQTGFSLSVLPFDSLIIQENGMLNILEVYPRMLKGKVANCKPLLEQLLGPSNQWSTSTLDAYQFYHAHFSGKPPGTDQFDSLLSAIIAFATINSTFANTSLEIPTPLLSEARLEGWIYH